jgi:hypothetical protein
MKFQVGDMCIVIGPDFDPPVPQAAWTIGECVQIVAVGPFPELGWPLSESDYRVMFAGGEIFLWDENTLRKLPPDDKQDYLPPETRKLFDGHKVKNPDKQPVAAVAAE